MAAPPPRPKYKIPLHPALQRTERLLARVVDHPTVNDHFMGDLVQARALLDRAIAIWVEEKGKLDEGDEEWWEISHLNYLAHQQAAIAVMKARGVEAQRALDGLQGRKAGIERPERRPAPVVSQSMASLNMPPLLQALRPRQHSRGLILTVDERHFLPGQAQLVNGNALLDALLDYLDANPAKQVACEGHSGHKDDDDSGQRLSQQRARAIQQALLERGLEFTRVTAVGYGDTRPMVMDGVVLGPKARVEIVISDTAPADYNSGMP